MGIRLGHDGDSPTAGGAIEAVSGTCPGCPGVPGGSAGQGSSGGRPQGERADRRWLWGTACPLQMVLGGEYKAAALSPPLKPLSWQPRPSSLPLPSPHRHRPVQPGLCLQK